MNCGFHESFQAEYRPLHAAAAMGSIEMLETLADNGAMLNLGDEVRVISAKACFMLKNLRLFNPLLIVLQTGWPALFFACQAGHPEAILKLLERGANVNHQAKV